MENPEITTGSVLGEALAVFAHRWWQYVILEAVFYVPAGAADRVLPWPWSPLVTVVQVGVSAIALGAVAWAVLHVEDLSGIGLAAYLRIADRIPRLVAASFVESIGVFLGFLALIVPGLLLIARWSVFIPAIVAEESSVMGFGRSSDLTRNRRWTGLWVAVLPALISLLWIVPYVVVGGDVIAWASIAIGLVLTAYGAVAVAVFYRRLVSAPEYA